MSRSDAAYIWIPVRGLARSCETTARTSSRCRTASRALIGARVVDGERDATRELLGEEQIVCPVAPRRARREEDHRAEGRAVRRHRDAHIRAHPELAHDLRIHRAERAHDPALVAEIRAELRAARAHHRRDAVRPRRLARHAPERAREAHLGVRVDVRDRHRRERPFGEDHHHAALGDLARRQARHLLQRRLVIERTREDAARLAEEGLLSLPAHAVGQVPGHVREAPQYARGVAHRAEDEAPPERVPHLGDRVWS
jgi:hypothetical protein